MPDGTHMFSTSDTPVVQPYHSPETRPMPAIGIARDHESRLRMVRIDFNNEKVEFWIAPDEFLEVASLIEEFNRIARLPHDWNSYGASPVDQNTLKYAFGVLLELDCLTPAKRPQISATVNGGVAFDWHRRKRGLELEILAPYRMSYFFYDEETEAEEERTIGGDTDLLAELVRRIRP